MGSIIRKPFTIKDYKIDLSGQLRNATKNMRKAGVEGKLIRDIQEAKLVGEWQLLKATEAGIKGDLEGKTRHIITPIKKEELKQQLVIVNEKLKLVNRLLERYSRVR